MIENRQFRFKEPQVAVPDGIPEAIERAAFGRALRWYVGEVGSGEVVVEATVDTQEVGNFGAGVGSLHSPGKAVAVSIIPTGIGCSIGGYAGDAAPVSRLLAST